MNRKNKTMSNLKTAWDNLDSAYENMEKAIELLYSMRKIPIEMLSELDRFDITAISSLKEHVEILIEETEKDK